MREHLKLIMDAALARVSTRKAVQRHLPRKPKGRCVVVGAGKAGAAMAAAVEEAWPDVALSGVVSVRYGHGAPTKAIRIIEAGHPVPDEMSLQAAREMFAALSDLTNDDLVLALVSGGGSASLAMPVEGVSLAEKQALTKRLLACGATIKEINTVRQALSRVKGGQLAAAAVPAQLVSLIISDIPGDDLSLVASGPTVPPAAGTSDPLSVIDAYQIEISETLRNTLKSSTSRLASNNTKAETIMIASNSHALLAAGDAARALGYQPLILGDALECESSELGKVLAALADSARSMGAPASPPLAIISGGETTVTLGPDGLDGKGGRNQEVMLSLAAHLRDPRNVWAFSIDTDGYDGFVDAAGAVVTPSTVERATAASMHALNFLRRHDSYTYFEALGDLVRIGPTLTNVNDLRVVLVR